MVGAPSVEGEEIPECNRSGWNTNAPAWSGGQLGVTVAPCAPNVGEKLPIRSLQKQVEEAVEKNKITFISGKTGVGKSTQVPQFLLSRAVKQKEFVRIAILQPRRLAARGLAKWVAKEMGTKLGGLKVGFRIAAEILADEETQMVYMTYGYFIERVMHDLEHLATYTHIIIDEVHEWQGDCAFISLILRFALENEQKGIPLRMLNPNVKIVMMSATLQPGLKDYFEPVVESVGEIGKNEQEHLTISEYYLGDLMESNEFSVICPFLKTHDAKLRAVVDHAQQSFDKNREHGEGEQVMDNNRRIFLESVHFFLSTLFLSSSNLYTLLLELIKLKAEPGKRMLIFLPGQQSIEILDSRIREWWQSVPHHANVKVLLVCRQEAKYEGDDLESRIKNLHLDDRDFLVVLATNIAESSITIEELGIVVDTGVHKIPTDGAKSLLLRFTSISSDKQRRGRTGRTCNGTCLFLFPQDWTYDTPEKSLQIGAFRLKEVVDGQPLLERNASRLLLHAAQLCAPWKMSFEDMFSRGVPPCPTRETIRRWVDNLEDNGFLMRSSEERSSEGRSSEGTRLTFLGRLAICLPVNPMLSKMFYNCWVRKCPVNGAIIACIHSVQFSFAEYSFLKGPQSKFRSSEHLGEIGLCFNMMRTFDGGHLSEPYMQRNVVVQLLWDWHCYVLRHTTRNERRRHDDAMATGSNLRYHAKLREMFVKETCNSRIFNRQAILDVFSALAHFSESFIRCAAKDVEINVDYTQLEMLAENVEFATQKSSLPFLSNEFTRLTRDVELRDIGTDEVFPLCKDFVLVALKHAQGTLPSAVKSKKSLNRIIGYERKFLDTYKRVNNLLSVVVRPDCRVVQKMLRFRELVQMGFTYGDHPAPQLFRELFGEDPYATKDVMCMSAHNVIFGQNKVYKIDSMDVNAPSKPRELDPVKKSLAGLILAVQGNNLNNTVRWPKMNHVFTGPFLYKFGDKLHSVAGTAVQLVQHVVRRMLKHVSHEPKFSIKTCKDGDIYITFDDEDKSNAGIVQPFDNENVLLKTCPALARRDAFRCPRGHLYHEAITRPLSCSLCRNTTEKGSLCTHHGDIQDLTAYATEKCDLGIMCEACGSELPSALDEPRPWPITEKSLVTEVFLRAHGSSSQYHIDKEVDPEIFYRNRRKADSLTKPVGPPFPVADNTFTFEWFSPVPKTTLPAQSGMRWVQHVLSPMNIANYWSNCPNWAIESCDEICRPPPPYPFCMGVNTLSSMEASGDYLRMSPMVTMIDPLREVSLLKFFVFTTLDLDFRAVVDRLGGVRGLELSGKRFLVRKFPFRFITLCQDIKRLIKESMIDMKDERCMGALCKLEEYATGSGLDEKLKELTAFDLSDGWERKQEEKWVAFAAEKKLSTPDEGWGDRNRRGFLWCPCSGFSAASPNSENNKDFDLRLVPLRDACLCKVLGIESVSMWESDPVNFWTEDTIGPKVITKRRTLEVVCPPRYRVVENFDVKLVTGDIVQLLDHTTQGCIVDRVVDNSLLGTTFCIPPHIIGLSRFGESDSDSESSDEDLPDVVLIYGEYIPSQTHAERFAGLPVSSGDLVRLLEPSVNGWVKGEKVGIFGEAEKGYFPAAAIGSASGNW